MNVSTCHWKEDSLRVVYTGPHYGCQSFPSHVPSLPQAASLRCSRSKYQYPVERYLPNELTLRLTTNCRPETYTLLISNGGVPPKVIFIVLPSGALPCYLVSKALDSSRSLEKQQSA
jgi:hypothetical protein